MKKLEAGCHVISVPNNEACQLVDLFPKEISGSTIELLDESGEWQHKEELLFVNNQLVTSETYSIVRPFTTFRLNLKRPIVIDWSVSFTSNSGIQKANLSFKAGFDFEEALHLCQLSDLVYEDEDRIEAIVAQNYDFDNFYYFSRGSHKAFLKHSFRSLIMAYLLGRKSILDLQFMYLQKLDPVSGKNLITIIFRGSQEPQDWMTNFSFQNVNFLDRGHVHQGFYQTFKLFFRTLSRSSKKSSNNIPVGIVDDIAHLNETSNIILAGHSLGGALATLAGCYLTELGLRKENMEVYTFGAPPVGTLDFCNYFTPKLSLFRIFNEHDVVPKFDAITNLHHIGENILLPSNNGEVHACGGYIDNLIDQIELNKQ